MHVVLLSLKSVPREMSMASMKTFEFVVRVCGLLYGDIATSENGIIVDEFLSKPPSREDVPGLDSALEPVSKDSAPVDTSSTESKVAAATGDVTTETGESEELLKSDLVAEVPGTQHGSDNDIKQQKDSKVEDNRGATTVPICPCQDVVQVLISELASTNQLLR